jgi:hypothetical protein
MWYIFSLLLISITTSASLLEERGSSIPPGGPGGSSCTDLHLVIGMQPYSLDFKKHLYELIISSARNIRAA